MFFLQIEKIWNFTIKEDSDQFINNNHELMNLLPRRVKQIPMEGILQALDKFMFRWMMKKTTTVISRLIYNLFSIIFKIIPTTNTKNQTRWSNQRFKLTELFCFECKTLLVYLIWDQSQEMSKIKLTISWVYFYDLLKWISQCQYLVIHFLRFSVRKYIVLRVTT